jgi:ABC-2 type transport system permease protein
MKTIFRVAKAELRTLFYSPIAWFLMIIFLIQCGVTYLGNLELIAREQDAGGYMMGSMVDFLFLGNRALFGSVMQNLYLYMPLLTMGLISRETSSGTIKLLHSSPVKVREIVLGKFLSMMIYSLLLVSIIGIFVLSSLFQVVSPDMGKLASGLLGFFLLLCAYAAIGLFMSSLTSYQIVAAICTFVMFGILSYIGKLWQDVAFIRNLTYFLSISGRTGKMLNGLITSKDVIYFIAIVYMFLGLTTYRMKAAMESRSRLVKVGRYALVIAITLTIGYISSIPSLIGYYDATANKEMTLAPNAQKIIRDMDAPLEVTAYNNLLGNNWHLGSPESYNVNIARWEPYLRFKHNIELKTVLYYDSAMENPNYARYMGNKTLEEIAKRSADSRDLSLSDFKSPAEIRKIVDLRPELNRYVMQLRYKGRTTFLRVFDDNRRWPSETEVSAAFKRLLGTRMPKIMFLNGHLERDINKVGDREYKVLTNLKTFRNSLINQGFDVDTFNIGEGEIPMNITALVLADPKVAFTPAELNKLERYIDKGGNILITGEPGKQSVLNPLLQKLGVQLREGILVQQSKQLQPDLVTVYMTATAATFYPPLEHGHHDSAKVAMPGVAALAYADTGAFRVKPLLMTDSSVTWLKKDKLVTDSAEVLYAPERGDEKIPFTTAVSLTRTINGKEQRIVVTGDADFISNAELNRFNLRVINFVFNTGLFSWLSYGEFPVDSSRPPIKDTKVTVTKDRVKMLKIGYIWVLPGLLLAFGSILLIRRKRK